MSTNKNNDYEEVDNSSETSKDYPSSNTSVDDTKKRNSFEDNKEEKNKDKRSKRNSFISIFKKDDKEKEEKEKEKPHSEGLSRSLSGIFNSNKDKDKDKEKEEKEKHHSEGLSRSISGIFNKEKDKRSSTVESEKVTRPSSNSDKSKNRRSFIFFSDDDDNKLDADNAKKGSKSRQNSNPDGVEKDKSTKLGNRISVNLGKLFENKPSHKQNGWDDHFIGPGETISPKSPRTTSFSIPPSPKNKSISNNTSPEYVESPKSLTGTGTNGVNKPASYFSRDNTSKERDDVQSTNSSTRTSSVDDQNEISFNDKNSSPTTPKLLVTHPDLDSTVYHDPNEPKHAESQQSKKDDDDDIKQDVEQNNVIDSKIESKPESKTKLHRNVEPLFISTDITAKNFEQRQQNDANDTSSLSNNEQVLKKLRELEEVKLQLEAKVAEQDGQISKFNSMEQIMQQQIDLSKRMAETIHRLESKVNVQKEIDGTNIDKTLEDTVKRLEHKVCQQNEELNDLKSIVSQLGGGNSQLAIMGIPHETKSLIMAPHEREDLAALIQSNHYSKGTLANTLVVKPLCNVVAVSAGIAISVLFRPVIGFIKVVKVARGGM